MKNIVERIEEVKARMNNISIDCAYDNYDYYARIDDAIAECADNNVSIYYGDIIKYIADHVEEVNETIQEFGWDGCGSDLYKAGQMAEYTTNQNELFEDVEEIILLSGLYRLAKEVEAMDESLLEELEDELYRMTYNNTFEEIAETVNDFLFNFAIDCEEEPEKENLIRKVA